MTDERCPVCGVSGKRIKHLERALERALKIIEAWAQVAHDAGRAWSDERIVDEFYRIAREARVLLDSDPPKHSGDAGEPDEEPHEWHGAD